MKKRIISLLLLASLLVSTCACSSNEYVIDEPIESADSDTADISTVTEQGIDGTANENKDVVTDKADVVTDKADVITENKDVETVPLAPGVTALDPFEGLKVEFDGISPFCTVSFNNAKCSEKVQQYVEYSIEEDKVTTTGKQFKINENVTVYASLKKEAKKDGKFALSKTQRNYKVENVPEYITEITKDMDLSKLKAEMKDYFDSITAFVKGGGALGVGEAGYASHTPIQYHESYFSSLKLHSHGKFKANKGYDYFNKINIMYSTVLTVYTNPLWSSTKNKNCYFTVCAKNIVRYPDGTLGWGKNGPDTLAFEYVAGDSNMESLVNANITSIKTDFNVSQINGLLP